MPAKALRGCALFFAATTFTACRSDRPKTDVQTSDQSASATPAAATDSGSGSSPRFVHVVATDYKLQIPDKIPAGAVTLHLMNEGKQLHHAMLARLDDGKTMADLGKAMNTEGPPPSWMKFVGGPNAIPPGGTATETSVLTPGNYVAFCVIPGPDGKPHAAKGMVQPFEVTAGPEGAAALPAADDTVQLLEYSFKTSHPIPAGKRTILVENGGKQGHELVLLKLAPGKSAKDFAVWATTGGMKGPPPAMPMGGVGTLSQNGSATFTADMSPGEYAFICFIPDAKDGKMHVEHGMVTQFTVS
jgi:uncharacterized cupredoxin-like copper-binding protein